MNKILSIKATYLKGWDAKQPIPRQEAGKRGCRSNCGLWRYARFSSEYGLFYAGETIGNRMGQYPVQRRFERIRCDDPLEFTVLHMEISDLKRVRSNGRMIDSSEGGVGLVTEFPLQSGHVLEWHDKHHKGHLHIGLVKWSLKQNNHYRAGLALI